MKLFKDSKGFIFSFGFHPFTGQETPNIIAWNDPESRSWQPCSTNRAGSFVMAFDVEPEFVSETMSGIIAYQPGKCICMRYVGFPDVWHVEVLVANG